MWLCRTPACRIQRSDAVVGGFCHSHLRKVECALSFFGINENHTRSLVVVHLGKQCFYSPEVGYGNVTLTAAVFHLAFIARGTQDDIAQESFHEMILRERRKQRYHLALLFVPGIEAQLSPHLPLVPRPYATDVLSFSYHFIQINTPHLGTRNTIANYIYGQEIVIGFAKEFMQASHLTRCS